MLHIEKEPFKTKMYNKVKIERLKSFLHHVHWDELLTHSNINDNYNDFIERIKKGYDSFLLLKRRSEKVQKTVNYHRFTKAN